MNFLSIIKSPFRALQKNIEDSRIQELNKRQYNAVNVMEYQGELCISVNGVPIAPIDEIGIEYGRLSEVLETCRETWLTYTKANS